MTKLAKMKKIRDQVRNLKTSPLYSYRTENNYHPVLGQGSHNGKILNQLPTLLKDFQILLKFI